MCKPGLFGVMVAMRLIKVASQKGFHYTSKEEDWTTIKCLSGLKNLKIFTCPPGKISQIFTCPVVN